MVGAFVFLCLASQNLFEREFYVPARMDLGVKLLKLIIIFLSNHITSTYYFLA